MDRNGRSGGAKVLVAGGTGLTGAAVMRRLLAADPGVRARGTYLSRAGCFLDDPRAEYVQADLRRPEDCARAAEGCDMAVLAVAHTGGAREANAAPWRQVTDNLVMDAYLLEALHQAGIKRAVYVSSASVYQPADGFIREDELDWNIDPHGIYLGVGWAKRAAEKLCRFWHEKGGMEIVIARSANIFGPCARFDPDGSHFVAALIRKAVARMDPFEVWGSLEVTRDVIYADDFGDAIVAMLARRDIVFDVFNLGSGVPTSVGEVMRAALRYADFQPKEIVRMGDAPTTIQHRGLDCTKIKDILGWTQKVGITRGIGETVAWWREKGAEWRR